MCRSYEEPAQLSPLSDNPRAAPCSESTGQTRKNDIDIDKVILENIDIDIDKDILGKKSIFFSRN